MTLHCGRLYCVAAGMQLLHYYYTDYDGGEALDLSPCIIMYTLSLVLPVLKLSLYGFPAVYIMHIGLGDKDTFICLNTTF